MPNIDKLFLLIQQNNVAIHCWSIQYERELIGTVYVPNHANKVFYTRFAALRAHYRFTLMISIPALEYWPTAIYDFIESAPTVVSIVARFQSRKMITSILRTLHES